MKVLFVGDSPTVSTGFARVTRAVCAALHSRGHVPTVVGLHYHGDPHGYPYSIYPAYEPYNNGTDAFGVGRWPYVAEKVRPDIAALLNDPWNMRAYLDSLVSHSGNIATVGRMPLDFPVIGCLAVDARNHASSGKDLNRLAHVITWTQFGADELASAGYVGGCTVIPHGTDVETFHPVARTDARLAVFGNTDVRDKFIVGVVGRNQPRKRLDLAIEYFAHWIHEHNIDDAVLFLHVAPTGESAVDIVSLAGYHGLRGKVLLSSPHVSQGNDEQSMRNLYNSLDVLLSTAQGEGWGLPASEAMACGVPVVAPDFSGFGSWARDLALLVPCYDHGEITAPLGAKPYTLGAVPMKNACAEALDRVYRFKHQGGEDADIADMLARAATFTRANTWEVIGDKFVDVFEKVARVPITKPALLRLADAAEVANNA